jgi:2'-hydroxyisoflavone reductase
MKALVLGGTRFLGRHLVEALRAAGHAVTLLNRGRSDPALFADLEQIHGDRDPRLGDGLVRLAGREWDAVFDLCGYVPRVVGASAAALRERAGCYVFVSSVSVYADFGAPAAPRAAGPDESAPLRALEDEASEDVASHYGALKAACERAVLQAFGARALIVRPGLIVGPHDPSGRFTYWPLRLARGGAVLAPAPADAPLQWIDARDLAAWLPRAVRGGHRGVFNAVGPVGAQRCFADLLAACAAAAAVPAAVHWLDGRWLEQHGVAPWTELPLWLGAQGSAGHRLANRRAQAAGLTTRALAATVDDTLAWARAAAVAPPAGVGLAPQREAALLARWAAPDQASVPDG